MRSTVCILGLIAIGGSCANPCHLVLDKTGRFLAVANYSGGNYSLFPVGSDGRVRLQERRRTHPAVLTTRITD
jgi:6-phosphogluconolactonase